MRCGGNPAVVSDTRLQLLLAKDSPITTGVYRD